MPPPAPPAATTAFLVVRRDGGYGDAFPLNTGGRILLGRAPTNRIVLTDDLCSREHAEVFAEAGGWAVRDLGSLNGTLLNGEPFTGDRRLKWRDVVRVGRTELVFTPDLRALTGLTKPSPALARETPGPAPRTPPPAVGDGLHIRKRLGQTKYHLAGGIEMTAAAQPGAIVGGRVSHTEALAVLFRLALDMADADSPAELAELAIDALLLATPAEVGAVLTVADRGEPELVAHRMRDGGPRAYHAVSSFVGREVLATKQAVLAEDVAADRHLSVRDSIAGLRATSLICAPVPGDDTAVGLLHLYRTSAVAPLNADDLEFALAVARQLGTAWGHLRKRAGLSAENRALKAQLRVESEMVGESQAMQALSTTVGRAAATKATVLVRGESGVGKELVARAVHRNSPRKDAPFVCLNCAALTETLLESELFGHEKGAFTGATERMAGKFEAADGGTIFLDEIGEMALATQAKFLRVLEGHPFERVGGNVPIRADVRVVAATNRPLEDAVRSGTFRKDLFYRLQVVQIDVPPLRDRVADVAPLADHFLARFARETGRRVSGFTPAAAAKLNAHRWPGNVRELRNVVERAVALGSGPAVDAADIWLSELDAGGLVVAEAVYEPLTLDELEKRHIADTLRHTDWNKSQAAAVLGVERSTLDRKIKAYGLAR